MIKNLKKICKPKKHRMQNQNITEITCNNINYKGIHSKPIKNHFKLTFKACNNTKTFMDGMYKPLRRKKKKLTSKCQVDSSRVQDPRWRRTLCESRTVLHTARERI